MQVGAVARIDFTMELGGASERVEVTSAVSLGEDTVKRIGDRVQEQTGRTVQLSSRVEPDILGGIVLRVGNFILDASIRNRLEQLRKQVARAA